MHLCAPCVRPDDGEIATAVLGKDKVKFLEYSGKTVAKVKGAFARVAADNFIALVAGDLAAKVHSSTPPACSNM